MEGVNRAQLLGHLGAKPELKQLESGRLLLKARVATNERYQDRQGSWRERAEWHTVILWGARAKALERMLDKGSLVYVEGRMQTRSWEDSKGIKRYVTEVVATKFLPVARGRSSGSSAPGEEDEDPRRGGYTDYSDDDIPF